MIKRPMKGAAVDDLSQVRFPIMASPKIDGFRCILEKHPLTSRLSPFPNVHFHESLTRVLELGAMLDGEVVVGDRKGKGVLQRTSSGLTSQSGKPDFRLWVFDCPMPNANFEARHREAELIVKKLGHPRIEFLRHRWIYDETRLREYLDNCLERGFEGIITRDPAGPYKEGKSTLREQFMLKVKPFEDAEGRITGWYEQMENTNEAKREATGKLKRSSAKAGKLAKGTLGGLILRDVRTDVEVRVGGGYSDRQRNLLWANRDNLLGKLVRYKKQTVGEKDKPRHPNFVEFVDFRPDWDMSDD
jgi:DNA ligase-1